ncbi:HAD-IB family hydrolase [Mesorhizobium sp. Cs1299R1N1]|uniref:HAD family hydrolase n=1 Tax=Mesorhizobium sp. Cs1299R1N1 TaxID=3015172 RepID=UPI00301CF8DD
MTEGAPAGRAVIAVYDLDGTITRSDTFVPFLLGFLARNPWRVFRCGLLPFYALAFRSGLCGNSFAKQKFLAAICGGASRKALADHSAEFAAAVVRGGLLPGALASIEAHRTRGDRLILISASLDLYVDVIARHLRFDDVIASKTRGGRLDGENCYGASKVARLKALLAMDTHETQVIAYSDHASDLPLLAVADVGYVVNPKPAMRRLAEANGLPVLNWSASSERTLRRAGFRFQRPGIFS